MKRRLVCFLFLFFTVGYGQLYISKNTVVTVKEGTIFYQPSLKKDSSYSEKVFVVLDTVLIHNRGNELEADQKDSQTRSKNIKSDHSIEKERRHSVYQEPEFKKVNQQILCRDRDLSILSGIDNFDARAVVSGYSKVYLNFNRIHEKSNKFIQNKVKVYDRNSCSYRNNRIRFENFVRPPPIINFC